MNNTPIWQLEQNLKHHEQNARTFRDEAQGLLKKAEAHDKAAEKYKESIKILKSAEEV